MIFFVSEVKSIPHGSRKADAIVVDTVNPLPFEVLVDL